MTTLGVAVVGTGILGNIHLDAYNNHPNARIVMVCDADAERAKEAARPFHAQFTADFRDVALSNEVDAVSIATPDFAHYEIALAMLENAKHILVEKPLTMKTSQARALVEEARRHNVQLMVDFQNRFHPAFVKAKKVISGGSLGKPVMAYARLSNPKSVPLEMISWGGRSGPEWFLAPHIIDLVRWLTGNPKPVSVYARTRCGVLKQLGLDVNDCIQMSIGFEDFFATCESGWILPESWPSIIDFELMIQCEKGNISFRGSDNGLAISGVKHTWPIVVGLQDAYGHTSGFFKLPILHFVDCIADDKEVSIPGEDGLVVTQIIEKALISAKEGKNVPL